ncbi:MULTISPECIES: hypothetical protein [unclassified Massilia]|nr:MULTISPECIES: hypothetical protein [unclassified Massilia]
MKDTQQPAKDEERQAPVPSSWRPTLVPSSMPFAKAIWNWRAASRT